MIKSNFEEQIKSLTEEKNKITVINERLAENLYRLTEKANLNEKEIEELKNKIIQLENNLRTKIERYYLIKQGRLIWRNVLIAMNLK